MTPEAFDSTLETLLSRVPYKVFSVELHGGRRFEIDLPRVTAFKDGIAVFLAAGGVPIMFDYKTVSQFIEAPPSTAA